jgi:hypothetical protein
MMMERNSVFRHAFSMSNIAIKLLKRRCYRDALQVLSDAIFCIRQQQMVDDMMISQQQGEKNQHNNNTNTTNNVIANKVSTNNQQGQEETSVTNFRFRELHQRAERILFSSDRSYAGHSPLVVELAEVQLYASDMQCLGSVERTLVSHILSSSPKLFPIYIDELDYPSEDGMEHDMDFEVSILFYNCAIAHYCLWQSINGSVNQPPTNNLHFDCAVQLFIMSHELCSETIFYLDNKETPLACKLMHIDAINLTTLVFILRRQQSSSLNRSVPSQDENNTTIMMFNSIIEKLICAAKMTAYKSLVLFGNITIAAAAAAA